MVLRSASAHACPLEALAVLDRLSNGIVIGQALQVAGDGRDGTRQSKGRACISGM